MEIGPKDIEKSQVVLARRDTREKSFVPMDGLAAHVEELLDTIQQALFDRALAFRDRAHQRRPTRTTSSRRSWTAVPGSSCRRGADRPACEAAIKTETQATIRNIPFTSAPATGKACIKCGEAATAHAWFAKGLAEGRPIQSTEFRYRNHYGLSALRRVRPTAFRVLAVQC